MSLIHDQSQEVMKSELDLFTVPPSQLSIEKSFYIEVPPTTAITDNAPVEFWLPAANNEYFDLNNSLLLLKVKITKPTGADLVAADKVSFVNYPICSLFSQLDVSLGGRLISQSSSTYPFRGIIELLMNYDSDTLHSVFSAGMFYKDTAGHMEDADPAGDNDGFTKRAGLTDRSHVVELIGPVHSDIFFQEKLMLDGIDIKLRFVRAKDEFCLIKDGGDAYKVKLLSASLYVKKVSVSPEVRLAHAQALLTNTAKYSIDRICVKNFSIPPGSRFANQENIFLGKIPKMLVVGFTDNDSFMGDYTKNPFNFKHFNLEYLSCGIDGMTYPFKPLQPDFARGHTLREFYQLVTSTGRHLKNRALAINRSDFNAGYSLFCFNLAPDDECGGHLSMTKSGNLRLEIRFANVLPNAVNLIVYAVFDSIIEISNRRQVMLDYY